MALEYFAVFALTFGRKESNMDFVLARKIMNRVPEAYTPTVIRRVGDKGKHQKQLHKSCLEALTRVRRSYRFSWLLLRRQGQDGTLNHAAIELSSIVGHPRHN